MELDGVITPMPTPTVGGEPEVATETLGAYTTFLVENGVDGLFPCGSIGEFSSLTATHRETIFELVVGASRDVPVLAGCGDTSVEAVLGHVDAASRAGADVAVVVTPYYLSTTQSGLRRFFETIADRATLPVMLYNIPALTGEKLSMELVGDLATHGNVVGIKDTSGDLTYLHDVIEATPDGFRVFQGATQLAAASLDAGADGVVAGPANVFPAQLSALYGAHRRGETRRVRELMAGVVHPLVSATAPVPTAAGMKHLVSRRGFDIGRPLPPLPDLAERERASIDECYDHIVDAVEV